MALAFAVQIRWAGTPEKRLNRSPLRAHLTAFLYQRMRDYSIGMIASRWAANGANACGAGGLSISGASALGLLQCHRVCRPAVLGGEDSRPHPRISRDDVHWAWTHKRVATCAWMQA